MEVDQSAPIPRTEQDLREIPAEMFPERFTTTATGEKFMILNTSNQQDSPIILGFASPSQLELLKTSEIWMADGVFGFVSGVEADWSTSMWRIVELQRQQSYAI